MADYEDEYAGPICQFCTEPIDREADSTWKQVSGWVGGPKKDSMRMREDTGEYAHDTCIQHAMKGMPPQQVDLFTAPVLDEDGPQDQTDVVDLNSFLFGGRS